MANNYGDVALNLPADWSRTRLSNEAFGLLIVGHEGGEADVFLTDEPDKQHQFKFVDPNNQAEISMALTHHYEFCIKGKWDKRENLWAWNAEGRIHYMGNQIMARDRKFYDEDLQKREDIAKKNVEREDNAVAALADKHGFEVYDEAQKPLRAGRRR